MKQQESYDIKRILREMQDEYWRGIEEEAEAGAVETREFVIFRLGNERYGLPTSAAEEVLRLPRIVRVPRLPDHIRGVINLRGQVVAVTDLRPLLGLEERAIPDGAQLVVVAAAGLQTALVAERVEGIRNIEVAGIEPLTEGLAGFPREAVEGQVADENGLVILLNLEQILARPEFVIDQKGGE